MEDLYAASLPKTAAPPPSPRAFRPLAARLQEAGARDGDFVARLCVNETARALMAALRDLEDDFLRAHVGAALARRLDAATTVAEMRRVVGLPDPAAAAADGAATLDGTQLDGTLSAADEARVDAEAARLFG